MTPSHPQPSIPRAACLAAWLPGLPVPQDWLRMLERVLKLSIPTLYWWLAMFYTLFDLWLNIVAEVLRFGDREFYKVSCVEGWVERWVQRRLMGGPMSAGIREGGVEGGQRDKQPGIQASNL